MSLHFQRLYDIVRRIPPGRVATYGQIAAMAGHPRAARVVGGAMRLCADPSVPCQRVVCAAGRLAGGFGAGGAAEQAMLLRMEGVPFLPDGRVDLARCRWEPGGE
ncbi:MAG: methylated-DNA--[protein]-cysteine S-methyltransferase [Clostridia bacterium]|nr:methylated-DNA--[protein]-cysteine S-methyltransferase [Clostridia bacterium]